MLSAEGGSRTHTPVKETDFESELGGSSSSMPEPNLAQAYTPVGTSEHTGHPSGHPPQDRPAFQGTNTQLPSAAELEGALVQATLAGEWAVARALARVIELRSPKGNVVPFRRRDE
jgi:hypothetical protein